MDVLLAESFPFKDLLTAALPILLDFGVGEMRGPWAAAVASRRLSATSRSQEKFMSALLVGRPVTDLRRPHTFSRRHFPDDITLTADEHVRNF